MGTNPGETTRDRTRVAASAPSAGAASQPSRSSFSSVRMLALRLHFKVRNEVTMLPSFLRCFPSVETLCIESELNDETTGSARSKFWKEIGVIECVQSHLRTLVFREFQGEQGELDFLVYIAENARELRELVIILKLGMEGMLIQKRWV